MVNAQLYNNHLEQLSPSFLTCTPKLGCPEKAMSTVPCGEAQNVVYEREHKYYIDVVKVVIIHGFEGLYFVSV